MFTFSLPNQQISIEIPIIEDTILEDEEFFLVEFVFINETVPVLTAGLQVNVTIIDDDSTSTSIDYCTTVSLHTPPTLCSINSWI